MTTVPPAAWNEDDEPLYFYPCLRAMKCCRSEMIEIEGSPHDADCPAQS